MSFIGLAVIAAGSVFTIIWIVHYAPLISTKPKTIWLTKYAGKFRIIPKIVMIPYSPRLFLCKLLVPFDVGISLFLVFAGMLGLTTIVTGISMMVFNVLTAVGFSIGVAIVHKWLRPRWNAQFQAALNKQIGSQNV